MKRSPQWHIAHGYAYGRMDQEDGSPNTSSLQTANAFADYWSDLFDSGASRKNMFDEWSAWRLARKAS